MILEDVESSEEFLLLAKSREGSGRFCGQIFSLPVDEVECKHPGGLLQPILIP